MPQLNQFTFGPNPGDLLQPVSVQSFSKTQDTYGKELKTWTTFLGTRAQIRPATGRELTIASQTVGQISHVITLRFPKSSGTVTNQCRVVYGYPSTVSSPAFSSAFNSGFMAEPVDNSRYFNVVSALNQDERNHTLTIYALEKL